MPSAENQALYRAMPLSGPPAVQGPAVPCSARHHGGRARDWRLDFTAREPVPLTPVAGGDRGGGARTGTRRPRQGAA